MFICSMLYQMLSFSCVSWKGKRGFLLSHAPMSEVKADFRCKGESENGASCSQVWKRRMVVFFIVMLALGAVRNIDIIIHYNGSKATSTKKTISCQVVKVNWWFGFVVWIPEIPLWKGFLLRGTPIRIPNHQFTMNKNIAVNQNTVDGRNPKQPLEVSLNIPLFTGF